MGGKKHEHTRSNTRERPQAWRNIKKYGPSIIAFSGGVDSTFVLKRAQQELGDQVLAVTAASETFPTREFDAAATSRTIWRLTAQNRGKGIRECEFRR